MKPWEFVIFVVTVFDHTCPLWRLSTPDIPFAYVDIWDIETGGSSKMTSPLNFGGSVCTAYEGILS